MNISVPFTFSRSGTFGVGIQQVCSFLSQLNMRFIKAPFELFALTAFLLFTQSCRNSDNPPVLMGRLATHRFPCAFTGSPGKFLVDFCQWAILYPPLKTGVSLGADSMDV